MKMFGSNPVVRQAERRGIEVETKGTDLKPDKGFDYNVGREAWKPDLSKYPPELRNRLEKELERGPVDRH